MKLIRSYCGLPLSLEHEIKGSRVECRLAYQQQFGNSFGRIRQEAGQMMEHVE